MVPILDRVAGSQFFSQILSIDAGRKHAGQVPRIQSNNSPAFFEIVTWNRHVVAPACHIRKAVRCPLRAIYARQLAGAAYLKNGSTLVSSSDTKAGSMNGNLSGMSRQMTRLPLRWAR